MKLLKLMLVLVVASTCLACGCKKKQVAIAPTSKNDGATKKDQVAQKKEEPEKPKDYPEEVYGDPEIFKGPRFQFLMEMPNSENRDSFLYSMAMDGTDIRKVISEKILFSDVIGIEDNGSIPRRSPDNRYVVFLGYARNPDFEYRVILIDLKERTSRIVDSRKNLIRNFLWTPDSKSFYYIDYNDNYMKLKYDVVTSELHATPGCRLGRAWISHDGKHFLKTADEGVEIADIETCKVLKKIGLPLFGNKDFSYSIDTTLVVHKVYLDDSNSNTVNWLLTEIREHPKQIKLSICTWTSNVIIGVNQDTLHYAAACDSNSDKWRIIHHNLKTGEIKGHNIPGPIEKITLFNVNAT